jgi:16S rRNA (cytosine967-C5)-methyltransferase
LHGVRLERPVPVSALPGFSVGALSVQDGAAQLAAELLGAGPGDRVLDACAAPGGKTLHILESCAELAGVTAIDSDAGRARRIRENLDRAGLDADVLVGDAADPTAWWDGVPYQRILLDAPCSATGVIRRHPDIKLLRKAKDIAALAETQLGLLQALWPLLSQDGILLYCTCSVLLEENAATVGRFLAGRQDAVERPVEAAWGHACSHGRQLLPGEDEMDGFYYACLQKTC